MYTVYQLIGIAEVKTIHSLLCHLLYLNMGELPLELLVQMVGSLSNSCILAQQVFFVMLCCSAASFVQALWYALHHSTSTGGMNWTLNSVENCSGQLGILVAKRSYDMIGIQLTITTVLVGVFIFGSFIEAFFSSKTRTCLAVQS
jgi:hypothetical protein